MRLPDAIEREIQQLEMAEERRGGQHAGVPRLRDLRWAIEKHLRELNGEDMRSNPTSWTAQDDCAFLKRLSAKLTRSTPHDDDKLR